MAYFWVQQWWALPIIIEEPRMGDPQRDGGRAPLGRMVGSQGPQGFVDDGEQSGAQGTHHSLVVRTYLAASAEPNGTAGRPGATNAPYSFNLQAPTPQQRGEHAQQFQPPSQPPGPPNYGMQDRAEGNFDMRTMSGALPNYRIPMQNYEPQQTQPRFPQSASSSAPLHQQQQQQQQQQQLSHLTGQAMGGSAGYSTGFSSHYLPSYQQTQQGAPGSQQYVPQQSSQPSRSILPSPIQQSFVNPPYFPGQQQPQPYMIYPGSYGQISPSQAGFQG